MRTLWRALPALFGLTMTAFACGARSEIEEPSIAAGGGGSGGAAPTERTCAPNCTIGHRCCQGGCGGPAAITVNDCCLCFPGEVSSATCSSGVCGGGECKDLGAACGDPSECCSGACDYPDQFSEKKNCLPN
ncbi:MAG: hypothetical protein U0441_35430 [Polyangiaceae bacterium]